MCSQKHRGYLQTAALRAIKHVMQAFKYYIVFRTFLSIYTKKSAAMAISYFLKVGNKINLLYTTLLWMISREKC